MVTGCSPLNQLQSIKIDIKIPGPKTVNYTAPTSTLFDLCVLFLMALTMSG